MAAIRGRAEGNIRGGEWRPLSAWEERHVVVGRKVVEGVSMEEIWRDYITTQRLLEIAEAVGNEFKAEMLRERLQMLENELKDAVMCDYEGGRWC